MDKDIKEYANLGIKLVSVYDILLNIINELEKYNIHKNRIKQSGNIFKKELEKEIEKFYTIAKDEETQKLFYQEIKKVESIISKNFN